MSLARIDYEYNLNNIIALNQKHKMNTLHINHDVRYKFKVP